MSSILKRILLFSFLVYIIVTQSIINGYAKDTDKLFKANQKLMSTCSKLTEGEDLNEIYFR